MQATLDKSKLKKILDQGLEALSLCLSETTKDQLTAYLELLSKWNKAFNLTAIRDPEQMMIKHILDSLAILPYVQGQELIDVGTGAGLPGLILALAKPDQHWTLLDSNGKKTRFLLQAKVSLNIPNIDIIHARVEAYQPDVLFDGVIARAWTSIHDMLMATKHLIGERATLWAMKGVYPREELEEIHLPFQVHQLTVPRLNEQRHLVSVSLNS